MITEKQYTLAIRKRVNGDRFFQHNDFCFEEIRIDTDGRYWLADPFLFEKAGKTYIFYEAFDLIVQRGCIGYSYLKEDGTFSSPKIIIKGCHKSFPFIFENDRGIFIMPESSEERNIRLYKAKSFPDEWDEVRVLVSDIFATDTIMIESAGKEYLLTSEQYMYPSKDKVISCWVKNRLIKIDDNNLHIGEIVGEGDKGIRNAGAIFNYEENCIRPGQNSEGGQYGKGLKFFKVNSFEPYQEEIMYEIDCDEIQSHVRFQKNERKLLGTHTYNSSHNYEVIDLSYIDVLAPQITMARKTRTGLKFGYQALKSSISRTKGICSRIKRKLNNNEEVYEAVFDPKAPWVFVSYIADPFYHQNDAQYLNKHQNKRETLEMGKIFNTLGYNAYFMLHTSKKDIPNKDFRLLFGHEPNVIRAKEKHENAVMIYYAVSTYYEHRNRIISEMTNSFNTAFNARVPERRLVEPHTAISRADAVLLIGSDKTLETYPEELRGKITKIHQSTQNCRYLRNIDAHASKEFFYLASTGNILKGIQCLIEFFSIHLEYTLHWIGPVEEDVLRAIKNKMTPNIHTYGFQDLNSKIVLGLAERCDFLIYPSGVEGGPGSVLNGMKSGLIPIVTPCSSFDGIDRIGYIMEDSSVEAVEKAIKWAMTLSRDDILDRKRASQEFVLKNYNLGVFSSEFHQFIKKWL